MALFSCLNQDTVKKLDQHVDDHTQYKEAHIKCSTWLTTMRDRLAEVADTGNELLRKKVGSVIMAIYFSRTQEQ